MNCPNFFVFRWCETYYWKALNEGYNFPLDLISIEGLHTKLWASKVVGILGQNDIWVLVSWLGTKYIIRGKMVVSPKSGLWWVLWICVCSWLVHAPKCSNYILTNLLFSLCRSVWVIELLVSLPSPISKLQHALLPPKCCESKSVSKLLFLPLSSPLDSQLSPSRSLGCIKNIFNNLKKAQFGQGLFSQTLSQHCETPEDSKFPQMKMHLGVLGIHLTPTHFFFIRGMCLGVNNKVYGVFLNFLLTISCPSHYIKH